LGASVQNRYKGTTKIAHMQILEVFFEKIFFLDMQKKRP
jgi:hypothetical protein